MVSGNFYIYGGGKWREINLEDASVEGWGRGKFVYAKHGKLITTKTSAVLSALRKLKSKERSAAREGARLAYKTRREKQRYQDTGKCDHPHCCHHSNTNRSHGMVVKQSPNATTHSIKKTDMAIQTSPSSVNMSNSVKEKSKKHRESTSSDDNMPIKLNTTAMVNSTPKKLSTLKLKRQWSLARSGKASPKKKVQSLKLQKEDSTKYNLYKRKGSNSDDSLVWVVMPKTTDINSETTYGRDKIVKTKDRIIPNTTKTKSGQKSQPHSKNAKSLTNIASLSQTNFVKNNGSVLKTKSNYQANGNDRYSQPQRNFKSISNLEKPYYESQNKNKELVINEDDIMLLRHYLMNNATDFNLLKFDEDSEYRTQFLFAINPVVNLERCLEITRMLRRDSQSEISLKDFASQLGLTSISEKNSPRRYKMRKRNSRGDKNISDSEIHKNLQNIKNKPDKRNHDATTIEKYYKDTETDSDFVKDSRHYLNKKGNDYSNKTEQSKTENSKEENAVSKKDGSRKRRWTETETESDFDEDKIRIKSRSLRSQVKRDAEQATKRYKTRQSIVEIKEAHGKINESSSKQAVISEIDNFDTDSGTETIIKDGILRNNKAKNLHKRDLTKSDSEVSDEVLENEQIGKYQNLSNKERNIKTKDKNTEEKSLDVETNTKRIKQTDRTRNSNVQSPLKRNKHGQFVKRRNVTKYHNDKSSKLNDRSKTKEGNQLKASSAKNSDEEFPANKEAKVTGKNNVSNDNLQSKNKLTSKINYADNNLNDRNNNMTDTNDDSESGKHESSDMVMKNVHNKLLNNSKNIATETLKGHTSESDGFIRPVIKEIKSLAVEVKRDLERPASVSSMQRVEYSNLEDHAIVSWVSLGGRARCVNGNRIWKELQEQYHNITGQHRSWHSLRNRYLRSILPRLGQLALEPSLVSRLRAAAHTGELKAHKSESRRNSIFGAPPAAGALSRARARGPSISDEETPPKRHKHDHSRKLNSTPERVLRSAQSSPDKATRSPRFSEIIRRFADKQSESSSEEAERNSPTRRGENTRNNSLRTQTTSESEESPENLLEVRKSMKYVLEERNTTRNSSKSRRSSKHSLQARNSTKIISTPVSEGKGSKQSSATKGSATKLRQTSGKNTRRLFNPNSMR